MHVLHQFQPASRITEEPVVFFGIDMEDHNSRCT